MATPEIESYAFEPLCETPTPPQSSFETTKQKPFQNLSGKTAKSKHLKKVEEKNSDMSSSS